METKQLTPAGDNFVIKAVYRGVMSPPSALINQYALYGWTGHESSSGFLDIAGLCVGVFASSDRF